MAPSPPTKWGAAGEDDMQLHKGTCFDFNQSVLFICPMSKYHALFRENNVRKLSPFKNSRTLLLFYVTFDTLIGY